MEDIVGKLKARFAASDDIELLEGSKAFRKEYSEDELKPDGFYADAIEIGGEDVTVAKELVRDTPVGLLVFSVGNASYEARYGTAALAAIREEEARKQERRLEVEARKQALRDATPRTEPGEFSKDVRPKSHAGDHVYFESEFGTYIPGDVITAPGRRGPMPYHVTGVGAEFDAGDDLKQRFYALPSWAYEKLSQEELDALPKNADEAAQARTKALNVRASEERKTAKMLGGKALKGTPKQRVWAEQIRKEALDKVPADVAEKLLSGAKFQNAKFWIENRGNVSRGAVAGLV